MVEVFVGPNKEARGKWTSTRVDISFDNQNRMITVPGAAENEIEANFKEVHHALTDNSSAQLVGKLMTVVTPSTPSLSIVEYTLRLSWV